LDSDVNTSGNILLEILLEIRGGFVKKLRLSDHRLSDHYVQTTIDKMVEVW
jgi:hypothetical protein